MINYFIENSLLMIKYKNMSDEPIIPIFDKNSFPIYNLLISKNPININKLIFIDIFIT